MIIAIWGRDGTGKSTLCNALGTMFAKRGITIVIDTDLTQPTLPVRINGKHFDGDSSLGRAISGIGTNDATPYLHQHPKQESLFYAGLTDRDEFLSYEFGLEADGVAQNFIERCAELGDWVILDISGQRTDPFLPCALIHAHKVIIPVTPDVQGVCWFNAVKPLLKNMNAQERVLPIAALVSRYHDTEAVEHLVDLRFTVSLPFVTEFRQMPDIGILPMEGTTRAALRYLKQAKKLWDVLKEAENQ